MDSEQKTSNVLLNQELLALAPLRLQEVFGIAKTVLVLELYNKISGRLFLVHDFSPQNPTLHLQNEKIRGQKTNSGLILKLKKYRGATVWFNTCEQSQLQIIINNDEIVKLLLLSKKCAPKLCEDVAIKFKSHNYDEVSLLHNFAQAKRYWENFEHNNVEQLKRIKTGHLEKDLKKKKILLKNIQNDLLKSQEIIAQEEDAKHAVANLHQFKTGVKNIELKGLKIDYKSSPSQLIAKIFDKIKKAKRAVKYIEIRIDQVEEEICILVNKLENIDNLDLNLSVPHSDASAKNKKDKKRLPYRVFTSSDGIDIYVGKSAKDNDELSLHYAKGNEWWFHIREGPGSHVVVKSSSDSLPPRTFIEAAMLAGHFSNRKNDASAELIYTRIKNLRKPKGFAAGKILVSQEKSFMVKMDAQSLSSLLNAAD